MSDVVIVDAIRTPIGALGGALAKVRPDDLAALVIEALVERNGLDPQQVEQVFMGCANQAGEDNRNVARMATLLAGLPVTIPAVTFNRLCASGLTAVNAAFHAIRAGEGDIFIAGGVESMSRAPYVLGKAESAYPFGNLTAYDTALGWRFPNPRMAELYGTDPMGETDAHGEVPARTVIASRTTLASLRPMHMPGSPGSSANAVERVETRPIVTTPATRPMRPALIPCSSLPSTRGP